MSRLSKLSVVILTLVLVMGFGTAQTHKATAQDEIKTLAKAAMDAVNAAISSGDSTAFEALLSADYVEVDAPKDVKPTDYLKSVFSVLHTGFPDGRYEIVSMLAEGDQVWVNSIFTGTNTGDLMGLPATGKKVAIPGIDFMTFKAGKLIKHSSLTDNSKLYIQLGFTLTPPTAESAATPTQ